MRRALCACVAGLAVAVSGCQDGGTTTPTGPASTEAGRQWVMPDVVGATLQAAQNRIQQVTGNPAFLTISHDASGRDREQVLDSNWKVCSQNVAPGSPFTMATVIDFGAVRVEETCP